MKAQESNIDLLIKARAEIDERLRQHKSSVTILFTDVVGSTAYFERYGDTAGLMMLHRHADLATAAVTEFQGTVIKTIGDSVMAEFPDSALAVRSAIEIQRRVVGLNQNLADRDRLQLRIGVNSGTAFHHGKDVYGDAVNTAARITKRSGPAQILISRSVRDGILTESDLRCTWLGKMTIEGKLAAEDVFEVIWTDTAEYRAVRADVTAALMQGAITTPGLKAEDLLQVQGTGTSPPSALSQRYDVLDVLGSGGMGVVYKARDRETGTTVAVKVLHPEIAERAELIERFRTELVLARKITHKNVCRVYDLNRFDNVAAISMEYIEGESLRAVLNRQQGLSTVYGLKIVHQVIAGLAEAHAQGVIHRDLKPENILIAKDGTVKVMDFGIARSVDTGATLTGTITGTPAYMSPEQAQGKPVDARSDIYALGHILYEVFAGRRAFEADTPLALLHKHIHESPAAPRALDPYLPAFLDRAIRKCLEKNPDKRFQSVTDLEAALGETVPVDAAAETDPVPAPHLSFWGRADTVLLFLGFIGLSVFMIFRDSVAPIATRPLEIDAVSARREAVNLARDFGRPFGEAPGGIDVKLEALPDWYTWDLWLMLVDHKPLTRDALAKIELPLSWRVDFWSEIEMHDSLQTDAGSQRYVRVDRTGRIEEFAYPWPPPPYYKPGDAEQRRQIANNAAVRVCGPLPTSIKNVVETNGGDRNASYSAAWKTGDGPGASWWAEVSMSADQVVRVVCFPNRHSFPPLEGIGPGREIPLLMTAAVILPLLFLFVIRGGHRSAIFWKRLPLAAFTSVSGVWLWGGVVRGFLPSFYLTLAILIGATGFFLLVVVMTENRLMRLWPGLIATYRLSLRGRINNTAVALAVIRGALGGLILIAIETALIPLSVVLNDTVGVGSFADPTPLAQSLMSSSPVSFVLLSMAFHAIVIGLILTGLALSDETKGLKLLHENKTGRKRPVVLVFLAGIAVGAADSSMHLHLAPVDGPWFGPLLIQGIIGAVLGVLFLKYDALTAMVAVATAVLWTFSYPLSEILAPIGNTSIRALFIGWWVVGGVAVLVAFRASLLQIWNRMREQA